MLYKLFESSIEDLTDVSYVDPDLVNQSVDVRTFKNTRKLTITLDMLNKLKKIRSKQTLERAKQENLFNVMYGNSAGGGDEEGGGPGGF